MTIETNNGVFIAFKTIGLKRDHRRCGRATRPSSRPVAGGWRPQQSLRPGRLVRHHASERPQGRRLRHARSIRRDSSGREPEFVQRPDMDHRLLHGDPVQPPHHAYWDSLHLQQQRCSHDRDSATNRGATASTASSRHPGGVNVVFAADGSTHFVKNAINNVTWWSLGSKNGGEVISSDSY